MKFQTARGWRVAASKLLDDLSEMEKNDIRTVDIDVVVRKLANRNSELSPRSLNDYRSRLRIAIQEFVTWCSDPAGYKPRGLNGKVSTKQPSVQPKISSDRTASKEQVRSSATETSQTLNPKVIVDASDSLDLSYPLRPDFLARVAIPRDLTTLEAKRLGAFLLAIAIDHKPE
ncbi:MAG: hypothetical protein H7Z11_01375 [Verrucomicrobia bacterium]|nr:hypothetical protein [Leptolyngbya sp. ES-bin-22]